MRILRTVGFTVLFLLIAFLLHLQVYVIRYGQGYSFDSVSNALFIVGVVVFFPSLMAQIGSYKFFYGIQFALRGMFSTNFRRSYSKFSDYLLDKSVSLKTSIFVELLLSSGVLIVLSLISLMLWSREL